MQTAGKFGALRLAAALVFFTGLAGLETAAGLERWSSAQDRHRQELLVQVDRQQEALARQVADSLGAGNRHVLHLSKHPLVRRLLAEPSVQDADARSEELAGLLRPYLASFPELDRVSVIDRGSAERFRCERMGGGVASLPSSLLAPRPSREVAELLELEPPSGVAVSPLVHDPQRVEVAESERRVFHLAAAVRDDGLRAGTVVVTIYAAPLLRALADFRPLEGAASWLLDDAGDVLADSGSSGGQGGASPLPSALEAWRQLPDGSGRLELDAVVLFARPTGVQPASRLLSSVPQASLATVRGGGLTSIATALRSLLVIAAIGIGSALFVRASSRSERLKETEVYLQRIAQESLKHRALMDAAADLVLVVEPVSERLEDWNPPARETLGLAAGAGAPPTLALLDRRLGEGDAARLREALRHASERPGRTATVGGLRLTLAEGGVAELDARCVGVQYGAESRVEIALADRTREREMERRARSAERLSSLGLVAAGVAHEINNPLEGIANYLALAERSDDPERRGQYLAQVRRGFQRIRDITGELLPIAREDRGAERAELGRVVERVAGMARLTRDFEGLRVETRVPDRPVVVRGGEGRVEQIVLNLLINAGRAMAGGESQRRGSVTVTVQAPGASEAELVVEDEGPGIDPADLDHLFDPFFSRSGGTGLGLSVSYGIARALGGDLVAENRAGGGARFRLMLPREDREPEGVEHERA